VSGDRSDVAIDCLPGWGKFVDADQIVKQFGGIARRAKRKLEALHAAAWLDD
jgi:hypothetical protein